MTTEKSETIRLQMMKENCNPEIGNCDGFCNLCKKALDMAIKELKQQPCEEREQGKCPFYAN